MGGRTQVRAILRYSKWCCVLAVAVASGCGKSDVISVSVTPRRAPPRPSLSIEDAQAMLDHMLTAVIPQGDAAWFFKLVGKPQQLEPVRADWEAFLNSVQLPASDVPPRQPLPDAAAADGGATAASEGSPLPSWTLPQGWRQLPGDAMRAATLEIPSGQDTLALTVTRLPMNEPLDDYLVQNVNRWLGQLGQDPLTSDAVASLIERRTLGGVPSAVVELRGQLAQPSGGMANGSMASAADGTKPSAADSSGAMPPGHPPIDGASSAAASRGPDGERPPGNPVEGREEIPSGSLPFQLELPSGWRQVAARPPRVAAFAVERGEASQPLQVVVTSFDAAGSMADPLVNAKRWAGEVGRGDLAESELERRLEPVQVSGVEGRRFALSGDGDPAAAPGVRVAMVRRDATVWFFKMSGPQVAVEAEREAFDAFLSSVRFEESSL